MKIFWGKIPPDPLQGLFCFWHSQECPFHTKNLVTALIKWINPGYLFYVSFTGLIPGPKSYFVDFPNVFITACGTSFYSQCLPPQSVNLMFSSTAMHWLHDKPSDVTGALHHTMITVPEEAEKFSNQAARDWETILLARGKELAPGKHAQYGTKFLSALYLHFFFSSQIVNNFHHRIWSFFSQF